MEKRQPTGSSYIDVLRNSKLKDVKIVLPQKRQVVEDQHHRCYVCHKALSEGMCYFKDIEGPDPKSGANSKGMRALCASCYFDINQGKKPEIKPLSEKKEQKPEKKNDNFWLDD